MIVGALGGGQLGRMLALAGAPLGIVMRFLDPTEGACCSQIADLIVADYDDTAALDRFAAGLDVATFEFENVPVEAVRRVASRVPTFPPADGLAVAQDRLSEKHLFERLDIPVPKFVAIETPNELADAAERLGYPGVLKTRRMGYDGKGQHVLRGGADVAAAWKAIGGVPLILEQFVDFTRELSLVAARGRDGDIVYYPLVENHHSGGILRTTLAPAPGISDALEALGRRHVGAILEELNYVGVLAVEFFEHAGRLLANEMAPRVHNSGHWTIEGAQTSQFENHLRAILGWPLGDPSPRGHAAMVNFIGDMPAKADILRISGAHFHDYGKPPRPGRKVGHATVVAEDAESLSNRLEIVTRLMS